MSTVSTNTRIRSQIKPFSGPPTYLTGWAGYRTFAQIMADCSPLAATILRRRHIDYVDIADALQRGFMVFYEQLSADPNMLVGQSKYAVADPVCNNCHQNYWARHCRHFSFDALDNGNTDHPDEWLVTGLEAHRSEKWAAWATATDTRMDIEQAMGELDRLPEQGQDQNGEGHDPDAPDLD